MKSHIFIIGCLFISGPALAAPAGDVAKGKALFGQCAVCHSVSKGEPKKIGPNLHGLFGSQAGSRPDFNYSPAMKASKQRWNDALLDAFLTNPQGAFPGNRMPYGGMKDPQSRRALITYLKTVTK